MGRYEDFWAVTDSALTFACRRLGEGADEPRMLEAVVAHSGFREYLRAAISVDEVRTFKPHPAVYALGPARLGLPRGAIGFVDLEVLDLTELAHALGR